MNGAEYLAAFLARRGVKTVYDYPGNSLLLLYPALQKAGISHLTTRCEQGAVFAAAGAARATGTPGVCFATSGPGATNLVTGLADAMLDSVPLLAFTGQVPTGAIGQDAFQEADLMGITLPVTKHNFLVKDVLTLPTVLDEAYAIATKARRGPVLVDLPQDVLCALLPDDAPAQARLPHARVFENDLAHGKEALCALLSAAKKPLLLVGGGAQDAAEGARRAVQKWNLPAVYTFPGKGVLDDDDPLCLGPVGIHGLAAANDALCSCDTLIAVGCRFSDRTLPDPAVLRGKCVIHADADAAELGKRVPLSLGIVCDAAALFDALNALPLTAFSSYTAPKPKAAPAPFGAARAISLADRALSPCRVVADVGIHGILAARTVKTHLPRHFLASCGLGTMGFGLPAAIGAAQRLPAERILLITGDGCIQMTLQELGTFKELGLSNLKILLCDNGVLGLCEQAARAAGQPPLCEDRFSPDFAALCAAYGLSYVYADDEISLQSGIAALCGDAQLLHLRCPPAECAPVSEGGKA